MTALRRLIAWIFGGPGNLDPTAPGMLILEGDLQRKWRARAPDRRRAP